MTNLSNRIFRLLIGTLMTLGLIILIAPFDRRTGWTSVLGLVVVLGLVNCLGWLLVVRVQKRGMDRPASFNQLVFLLVLTLLVSKGIFTLEWSPFLAPLSLFSMVMALIFGQPVAFLLVLGLAFYLGIMSPREAGAALGQIDLVLAISLAVGGATSILGMSRVRQQSWPVLVGVYAGIAQAATVLSFQLLAGKPGGGSYALSDFDSRAKLSQFLQDPTWTLIGGLLSGAVVTCFLPALERFFGILTERRLLSLTDPNSKLLRALRNLAPGTYTHTLRVADLASAAGEAIGADPLLALVGAYYHDIGKIAKPEYFVENKDSSQNVHDKLRPSLSKLIIITHVKDGVELAEEAGLPHKIVEMIPMHHGTTVVEYFFHKAKAEGDTARTEVEYRYPGPKPRFREAGILMLADGVEAAAKTLTEPNPSRFRTIVHEMVLKKLLDHQLDESDLTMCDLSRIEESFVRTLTSMYHGRIRYPGAEAGPSAGPGSTPVAAPGPPPAPKAPKPPPAPGEADHEPEHLDRRPAEGPAAKSPALAANPAESPRAA